MISYVNIRIRHWWLSWIDDKKGKIYESKISIHEICLHNIFDVWYFKHNILMRYVYCINIVTFCLSSVSRWKFFRDAVQLSLERIICQHLESSIKKQTYWDRYVEHPYSNKRYRKLTVILTLLQLELLNRLTHFRYNSGEVVWNAIGVW